jgi:hypothetical protein
MSRLPRGVSAPDRDIGHAEASGGDLNPDFGHDAKAERLGEISQPVDQFCLQDGVWQLAHVAFDHRSVDVLSIWTGRTASGATPPQS